MVYTCIGASGKREVYCHDHLELLAATHTLTVSDDRACCILKFPIIRTRARLIAFMLRLGAINPDRR